MSTYRVRTTVTASVEELWIIDAQGDLTDEQVEALLWGDDTVAEASVRHVEDTVAGDERDREILKIEAI